MDNEQRKARTEGTVVTVWREDKMQKPKLRTPNLELHPQTELVSKLFITQITADLYRTRFREALVQNSVSSLRGKRESVVVCPWVPGSELDSPRRHV